MRKAAAAGNTSSMLMYNLAVLLHNQGKDDEAIQWLRKAAAAGDADAMEKLAGLLSKQGMEDEAEQWRRKASAAEQQDWRQPKYRHKGSGVHQTWSWGWQWGTGGGSAKEWVDEMSDWAAEAAEHTRHDSHHHGSP